MLYVLLFLLSLGFLSLDGPRLVYHKIRDTYSRFRSLNQLVSNVGAQRNLQNPVNKGTNLRTTFTIIWISLCMVVKAMYITLCQKLNKSVHKIGKNLYEIRYVIEGRMYRMLVAPKRGPTRILQVIDEDDNDITDEVLPYLGPQELGTHGCFLTPRHLGKQTLVFNTHNGDEIIVREHDVLDGRMLGIMCD